MKFIIAYSTQYNRFDIIYQTDFSFKKHCKFSSYTPYEKGVGVLMLGENGYVVQGFVTELFNANKKQPNTEMCRLFFSYIPKQNYKATPQNKYKPLITILPHVNANVN